MSACRRCVPGRTCDQCRRYKTLYRERKASMGLCGKCSRPVAPGSRTRCIVHLEKQRKRTAAWRKKQRDSGMCQGCGQVPAGGRFTKCMACRQAAAWRERERRAQARGEHAPEYSPAASTETHPAQDYIYHHGHAQAPSNASASRHIPRGAGSRYWPLWGRVCRAITQSRTTWGGRLAT